MILALMNYSPASIRDVFMEPDSSLFCSCPSLKQVTIRSRDSDEDEGYIEEAKKALFGRELIAEIKSNHNQYRVRIVIEHDR